MCAGAMVMSQLGRCVFGAADPRQGCCGSVYDLPGDAALHGVTRWQGGLLAEECAGLLADFFAKRRGSAEAVCDALDGIPDDRRHALFGRIKATTGGDDLGTE